MDTHTHKHRERNTVSATYSLSLPAGDDEQSDWFFEGDCGGVAGLLSGWDSDNQLSLEDKHTLPAFLQPARPTDRGCGKLFCLFDS